MLRVCVRLPVSWAGPANLVLRTLVISRVDPVDWMVVALAGTLRLLLLNWLVS